MSTEQHEPKEEQDMTEPARDDAAEVVELAARRGDVDRPSGQMTVGGVNVDRELLARTICADLDDNELDLFVAVCNRTGLDPFAKQIYAIKRNDRNSPTGKKMGVQTSIDGFRLIAERSGKYAGQTPIEWLGEKGGQWVDVWLDDDPPVAARVGVYKAGFAEPLVRTATWRQYAQLDSGGKPMPMWKRMPALMLGKCAEALALRAAFPAELSGLYTDDEMMQAESATYAGPRGTGQQAIPAASQASGDPADADVLVDLQTRVLALPDDERAALAAQWKNVDRLRGCRLPTLTVDRVRIVESLIRGAETAAAKAHDEWSPEQAAVTVREQIGAGAVWLLSACSQTAPRSAVAASAASDGPESAETSDPPVTSAESDTERPPDGESDEQRAERAKKVAADAGLTPASTLLDTAAGSAEQNPDEPLPEIGDDVIYPLVSLPRPADPDNADFLADVPTALVDHVIAAVKELKVGDVNKALRAHDVRPTGPLGDNDRRARLTLAILRLLLDVDA